MDSTELVTAIVSTAFIPTVDPVFTSARLRIEATDSLHTIVERAIVNCRSGYWLKRETVTTVADKTRYRVPYRAIAGTAEAIRLGDINTGSKPPAYRWMGDYIEFETAPAAGQTLHWEYYLRPSRLVEPQTAGCVTAINVATGTLTINSIPNRLLGTGAPNPIGGIDLIAMDVVKPNGWHEVCVVNRVGLVSGSDVLLVNTDKVADALTAGIADVSDVEIGDYVRAADETDWPCLPDDFHRTLADIAAARVLTMKGLAEKAGTLTAMAGPALERLQDLLNPRVKNDPPAIVPSVGILRRRGAHRSVSR